MSSYSINSESLAEKNPQLRFLDVTAKFQVILKNGLLMRIFALKIINEIFSVRKKTVKPERELEMKFSNTVNFFSHLIIVPSIFLVLNSFSKRCLLNQRQRSAYVIYNI